MSNYSQKLDKALVGIKKRNLDGLIIYSSGLVHILRPSYLYYFAGYRPFGPNNAMVISKTGDVYLLVEPAWNSRWSAKKSGVKNTLGTDDFNKDIVSVLNKAGIKGSVGVVGSREMTASLLESIKNAVKTEPAEDIIEEMAKIKTKEEIDNIRKVAEIADIGFKAFLEYSRVGVREYELLAEIEFAMKKAGADESFILLGSEKHNLAMHFPRDKRLTWGDIVLGEITPVRNGQFIQLCRTVVLGQPSELLEEKYNMLLKALDESLSMMKADVPAAVLSKAMNRVISDAGYAKYCYPPYMRARGHGFGVGSIAPGGNIDDNLQEKLVKDQVVIVHPNQYLPETGYLACGETVLVTDTGIERLAKTQTSLYKKEA